MDGLFVAMSLIDGEHQSVSHSRSQAKKLLERRIAKELKGGHSQRKLYKSVELEQRSFPAQPMHIHRHRRYPAGPSVNVPIRVVRIVDEWDKLFAVLPDFGIEFYCPVEADFGVMLQDTVRSMMASISPEEIVQLWAPPESEIDWVRVKIRSTSNERRGPRTRTLAEVAEPLGNSPRPLLPSDLRIEELREVREHLKTGNCLLVGETGVGKTTLLSIATRELHRQARMRAKQSNQRVAVETKFWLTSASRLIAGMRYLGQWQERIEKMIAELSEIEGTLLVENLRDLITMGGQAPSESLGAFLIPYLRTGQLRIACEATPQQVSYCQRYLPSLVDLLAMVRIEPLNAYDESRLVEYVVSQRWSEPLGSESLSMGVTIQRLCRHFLTSRSAPSASVPFVEQWLGKQRQRRATSKQIDSLSVDGAIEEFSQWTGLPKSLLSDRELLDRTDVEHVLAQDVIGQSAACHAATSVVMRLKSSMNDIGRPFGCLLFCGPTGVGKTQLAKSLAKYLFGADGQKTKLNRLDMSEYQSGSAGHRFLNDSSCKPARWIQEVRNQPLQVLLFDEIEKASPEVFDILLSLLDEGRLTDGYGNLTNFRSTVVLMTSNLGSTHQSLSGFHGGSVPDYASAVRKAMRPEFINRLDGIVPFSPLSRDHIQTMTRKELREAVEREGIQRLGLRLSFGESLVRHLAEVGFSATLGARPLQRTIETTVMANIANWIVADRPVAGMKAQVDWDDELGKVRIT